MDKNKSIKWDKWGERFIEGTQVWKRKKRGLKGDEEMRMHHKEG